MDGEQQAHCSSSLVHCHGKFHVFSFSEFCNFIVRCRQGIMMFLVITQDAYGQVNLLINKKSLVLWQNILFVLLPGSAAKKRRKTVRLQGTFDLNTLEEYL